jgi:hypothetical protein
MTNSHINKPIRGRSEFKNMGAIEIKINDKITSQIPMMIHRRIMSTAKTGHFF